MLENEQRRGSGAPDGQGDGLQAGEKALPRRGFLRLAAASAGAMVAGGGSVSAFATGYTPPPPPKVYCPKYPKPTSLAIKVCNVPHGFVLEWIAKADYGKKRWCYVKFYAHEMKSGTDGCVVVNVGAFPDWKYHDVDTNCSGPLKCDTEYYFRARALGKYPQPHGSYCEKIVCKTAKCQCTYTQGYWKNHPEAWPVSSLKLGSVTYTKEQLLAILRTPVRGNGLISLAHQLIAAKLNVANGADDRDVRQAIAQADALIGSLVIPPVGNGFLAPSATSALNTALANYNEGRTGPGHCDDKRETAAGVEDCSCNPRA